MKTLLPIAATALALAAAPAAAQDADTVLATVGDAEITLGHVVAMRARLPQEYQDLPDEVLYQGLLDQLVQQQVLSDEIEGDLTPAEALALENEMRAFRAARLIDRVGLAPLDEDAVRAAYDDRFAAQEAAVEWNASHILVETEEKAREIIARIDDGDDFAELAQAESTGPSGPSGGSLGWFGSGQMVPAFEEAVTGLEPGEVSPPVQTQFGWHVVRLNETRDRAAPPLDAVRGEIEQALRSAAVEAEIQRLTEAATVERTGAEVDPALIRDDALIAE